MVVDHADPPGLGVECATRVPKLRRRHLGAERGRSAVGQRVARVATALNDVLASGKGLKRLLPESYATFTPLNMDKLHLSRAAMLIIGDVAVGPTTLFGGLALGLIVFIPILIIEALALWGLKWGSFGRVLLDALLANVASAIFGLVFFTIFYTASFQCQLIPYDSGQDPVQSCDWTISPILWFIAMAALSILIEGGVLLLLKRHP